MIKNPKKGEGYWTKTFICDEAFYVLVLEVDVGYKTICTVLQKEKIYEVSNHYLFRTKEEAESFNITWHFEQDVLDIDEIITYKKSLEFGAEHFKKQFKKVQRQLQKQSFKRAKKKLK